LFFFGFESRKTVRSLQERLQTVEQMNKSLIDDAIVQKIRVGQLEEDLAKAKAEKESIKLSYQSKIDVRISQIVIGQSKIFFLFRL
jgi:hypothetical protein